MLIEFTHQQSYHFSDICLGLHSFTSFLKIVRLYLMKNVETKIILFSIRYYAIGKNLKNYLPFAYS